MAMREAIPPTTSRPADDTVGPLVERSVALALLDETAASTIERLRGEAAPDVGFVIVVDVSGRYAGMVGVRELLLANGATPVRQLARLDWPSVGVSLDREAAVEIATAAGVSVLPVLAPDGRPIGCLSAMAMMRVLVAEHHEDVHRMAGILKHDSANRHALEDAPLHRVWLRLPWLIVGLALSAAGTAVMAGFENTLKANVSVAFFIPALVYLTDAIGTQTEAIAVRGLTTTRRPFGRILLEEIVTGLMIGCTLGLLAVAGIVLVFGDWRIAIAVGGSLVVAGALACAIGLFLPWAFSRLGSDPALGSGPVATIIQDVLTLVVYFVLVSIALRAG